MLKRSNLAGEITGSSPSATQRKDTRQIQCLTCKTLVQYRGLIYHCNFNNPEAVADKIDKREDVLSKVPEEDSSKVEPRQKHFKRKNAAAKSSKSGDSKTPSGPKEHKKARSTPATT